MEYTFLFGGKLFYLNVKTHSGSYESDFRIISVSFLFEGTMLRPRKRSLVIWVDLAELLHESENDTSSLLCKFTSLTRKTLDKLGRNP